MKFLLKPFLYAKHDTGEKIKQLKENHKDLNKNTLMQEHDNLVTKACDSNVREEDSEAESSRANDTEESDSSVKIKSRIKRMAREMKEFRRRREGDISRNLV